MQIDEKKPQVLQLGAESTFEGGGDKPKLYANFVALQHFADNCCNKFTGEHTWNAPSAGLVTLAPAQAWVLLQKQAAAI
jgi:hypothetical protein